MTNNNSVDGKSFHILILLVAFAKNQPVESFTLRNIQLQLQSLKFYSQNYSFQTIRYEKTSNSDDDNWISNIIKEDEEAKQWLSGKQLDDPTSAASSDMIDPDANARHESYKTLDFSDIDAIVDPDHDSFLTNAWNEFQMNSDIPDQGMASAGAIAEYLLRNELEQRYIQGEVSQDDIEDDMQTIREYISRKQGSEMPPPISQLKQKAKEERSKRFDVETRLAEEISSKQALKEKNLAEMKRLEKEASEIETKRAAEKAELEKLREEAKTSEENRLAEAEKWREELQKVEEKRQKELVQRDDDLQRKEENINSEVSEKQTLKEKYIAQKLEEKRQEKIRLEQWAKESNGSINAPEEDSAYNLYLEWAADELNENASNETEPDRRRVEEIISSVKSSFGITNTDEKKMESDKIPEESKKDRNVPINTEDDTSSKAKLVVNITNKDQRDVDKLRTERLKELYIAQKLREKRFKERESISQEESIVMRSVEKARLEEELRAKPEIEILDEVKKDMDDTAEQERIDNDRRNYFEKKRREEEMIVLDEEESLRQAHLSEKPIIDIDFDTKLNTDPADVTSLENEEMNRREKLKQEFIKSRHVQSLNLEKTVTGNDEIILDHKIHIHSSEEARLAEEARVKEEEKRREEEQQRQKEEKLREEAQREANEKKLKEARLAEEARVKEEEKRREEEEQQRQKEEMLREEARREKKLKEARLAEEARVEEEKRQEEEQQQRQKEEVLREEARREANEKKLKETKLMEIRLAKQKREKEEQIRKTNELMMSVQEHVNMKKDSQSLRPAARTKQKTFKVMNRIIENPSDKTILKSSHGRSIDKLSMASRSRLFRVQARTSDILKRIKASAKGRIAEFEQGESNDMVETSEMNNEKLTFRRPSRNSRLFIKPTPYRYGEFKKASPPKSSRSQKRDVQVGKKKTLFVLSALSVVLIRRVLQLIFGRFPI